MLSKYVHEELGIITLAQSNRNSRISLSVKPSGEIRLSYPTFVATSRALDFLDSRTEWVKAALARLENATVKPNTYSKEQIEALRQQAKQELPKRVAHLANQFGFSYGRVTIRATRSKWGCCTSQNNLSLSLFLVTLPEQLQDYVIIHELCHTIHHNHSAQFHALVNRCVGGREKELNQQLRKYRTL